jgi:hypothetical protein
MGNTHRPLLFTYDVVIREILLLSRIFVQFFWFFWRIVAVLKGRGPGSLATLRTLHPPLCPMQLEANEANEAMKP